MSTPWDQTKPDLSRLPPHLRDALTAPVPRKEREVAGKLAVITRRPGLNHPNARVWLTPVVKEINKEKHVELIIEMSDHRGQPQAVLVLSDKQLPMFREAIEYCFSFFEGTAPSDKEDNAYR